MLKKKELIMDSFNISESDIRAIGVLTSMRIKRCNFTSEMYRHPYINVISYVRRLEIKDTTLCTTVLKYFPYVKSLKLSGIRLLPNVPSINLSVLIYLKSLYLKCDKGVSLSGINQLLNLTDITLTSKYGGCNVVFLGTIKHIETVTIMIEEELIKSDILWYSHIIFTKLKCIKLVLDGSKNLYFRKVLPKFERNISIKLVGIKKKQLNLKSKNITFIN